ncbi:MAG: hypothetical protein KDC14_09730, partial [Planctomycetes bacterium]|nr:hypothetical protein [Planctomycetota bacterium]
MRRLDTCILLLTLCACSSTPKAAPEQAFDSELVAEAQAAALEGPDGWNYVGVSLDGDTPEFVLARDGRRFVIPGAGYERFVPTLGGNVFAVDEAGVWWHFFEGERLASMPWADMRATGAISGNGDEVTGRWPVRLAAGGCAKVDHVGNVIEEFPDAAALELVVHTWILEDADGSITAFAPGGEPLTGGERYAAPAGSPLIYFPADRTLFDPVRLDFKRMNAVPSVRLLATDPDRVLLGLVPSFEGDETVALYDYYAGETRERRQRSIEVLRVDEPAYSPHVAEGLDAQSWQVVLCFAADDDHWSAWALDGGPREPRLGLVLRGTGDRDRAVKLLEAELVSRRSH